MLNTIVFAIVLAITLVVSNLIVSFAILRITSSPKFLTAYIKRIAETTVQLEKELNKEEE